MDKIVILTGANRGLGKSLIDSIIKTKKACVLSLSRCLADEHVHLNSVFLSKTDLREPFQVNLLNHLKNIVQPNSKIYFFNNASVILPIEKVGAFKNDEITNSIKVNIEFPVGLVNYLIANFSNNEITLVNITSGAGINPVPFWSLYGASKAYMKMFFKVIAEEFKATNRVLVYDIDPGVLDTDMQKNIREASAPKQGYFVSLKEDNKLIMPGDAAEKILNTIRFQA